MPASDSVTHACQLLQQSRYGIALTGAGASTPSGIPDFRSPNSGVWENVNQMEVASLFAFRRRPEAFYNWIRPMVDLTHSAKPNPAHLALAELEQAGKIRAIITQNIDGLHTLAGSQRVIELHGNFQTATCVKCYQTVPGDEVLAHLSQTDSVPSCQTCGGVLKLDVILYGEQLPITALHDAKEAVDNCDLIVVIGSSLTVEPAASLPVLAKQQGAKLVIINLQPTPLDYLADAVIRQDLAQVLPEMASYCRQTYERSG